MSTGEQVSCHQDANDTPEGVTPDGVCSAADAAAAFSGYVKTTYASLRKHAKLVALLLISVPQDSQLLYD